MDSINIAGTPNTPTIKFDPQQGKLEIRGISIPEQPVEFYRPLVEALRKYTVSPAPKTEVILGLEYLNTASTQCVTDVLRILVNVQKQGNHIEVSWLYAEEDEDMLETGKGMEFVSGLAFKMIQI